MTLVILAPDLYGGLRLFSRLDREPLRPGPLLGHPRELQACLRELPAPRTVVLCGKRFADLVSDVVLDLADLVVVPNTWFRHLPVLDAETRASHAARVAVAHARAPLETRLAREPDWPF
jgi:hypothetical protein